MTDTLIAWGTVGGVIVAIVLGIVGVVQSSRAKEAADGANTIAESANDLVAEANRVIQAQAAREIERSDVAWDWRLDPSYPEFLIVQNIGKNQAMQVVVQFFFDGESTSNHPLPLDMEGQKFMRLDMPGLAEARYQAWEAGEIARLSYGPDAPQLHSFRVRVSWNTPLGSPKLLDTGVLRVPVEGFPRR
jgi:hypothetical protein